MPNDEEKVLKAIPINVAHLLQFKLFQQDVGPYAFDNEYVKI